MAWYLARERWPRRLYGQDWFYKRETHWVRPWTGCVALSSHGCVVVRAWTKRGCARLLEHEQADLLA